MSDESWYTLQGLYEGTWVDMISENTARELYAVRDAFRTYSPDIPTRIVRCEVTDP